LLDAQRPVSGDYGPEAHDELLFIIVHQAYELWFKLILFELESVIDVFSGETVDEKQLARVISRLERVQKIQEVLLRQIDVVETMTPMDFLEFRDLLVPASGFQSVQFKRIEIALGLRRENRIQADQEFFATRLTPQDRQNLEAAEQRPGLLELTARWLERMPFLKFEQFDFWEKYRAAVEQMLDLDERIVHENPSISQRERDFQLSALAVTRANFENLFDPAKYETLRQEKRVKLSQKAFLAAIFIFQYRDEPILFMPFRYLTNLLEVDEMFTRWRSRHALMVQRMLGTKIGTGGSSGHEYLSQTTRQNRVFTDLYHLATYLIPRSALPKLPASLEQELGFHFTTSPHPQ
jgi:tryptophan 2,3-dioxygenase